MRYVNFTYRVLTIDSRFFIIFTHFIDPVKLLLSMKYGLSIQYPRVQWEILFSECLAEYNLQIVFCKLFCPIPQSVLYHKIS